MRLITLFLALFALMALAHANEPSRHSLDETIPEARHGYYSDKIYKLLESWPPLNMPEASKLPAPVWMVAIRTPGEPNTIGVEKAMLIHAPMERVVELIDGFDHYKDFFSGLAKVNVIARDGNKITTRWEREAPVFFLPRIRYEQIYLVDKTSPDRVIYRYELKSGNAVNSSDGIIVVERRGPRGEDTLLSGFDFFEANWGLLRTIAENVIWKNCLEGSYRGDVEFRLKAEHPSWTLKKVDDGAKRIMEQSPIELDHIQFLDHLDFSPPDKSIGSTSSTK